MDYGQHAERAWEGDALGELGDLLWRNKQCGPLSQVIAGVLQSVAAATVAAFQLAPSQLPPLALEQLLRVCEGIYTGVAYFPAKKDASNDVFVAMPD